MMAPLEVKKLKGKYLIVKKVFLTQKNIMKILGIVLLHYKGNQ